MKTSEFDYYLPKELIAQTPIEPRDASRLMVLDRMTGAIEHRTFRDIVDYLRPGDVLVCNQSRVIPARLFGHKVPTGGKVELLLLAKRGNGVWEALVKPGRRVRVGTEIEIGVKGYGIRDDLPVPYPLAPVIGNVIGCTEGGGRLIRFLPPIEPLLDELGIIPLPPYIHEQLEDRERYQTIYARVPGSVAAPTAGLHFTPELMERIKGMGVEFAFVTLHISLDTFRPVRTETVEEHRMQAEYYELSPEVAEQLNRTKGEGRRIIAVGTTSVRVLETASQLQFANCSLPVPNLFTPFSGWTNLFVHPSYQFRAVDALITNFHLPRSTLLMLVTAFAGKELIERAYQEAIRRRYRFYSFGDAMFIC